MGDERRHLAIGEVLAQLQDEFPEVTISKIRFLESQGLIDPERSPSGYRKFYPDDIERLRWVLHQQRDNFLPLKVIKARLQSGSTDGPVQPALFAPGESEDPPVKAEDDHDPDDDPVEVPATSAPPSEAPVRRAPARAAPAASGGTSPTGGSQPRGARAASASAPMEEVSDWLSKLQESPQGTEDHRGSTASASTESARATESADPVVVSDGVCYGFDEMVELSGVDGPTVTEMVSFGLLSPRVVGGEDTFDAAALDVARGVAAFLERGVEIRHLRMFKNAADREAGFYEQMILPLLKQRNPAARQRATETLGELIAAGDRLRRAQVRHALREHLE